MAEATPRLRLWGRINFILALLVLATFPVAALGSRTGLWSFGGAVGAIAVEAGLGGATMASSVILLLALHTRQISQYRGLAWLSLFIVIASLAPVARKVYAAKELPPIHDITTDVANPPVFVNATLLRPEGSNSLTYGGPKLAQQQKSAYPDVAPIVTPLPPGQAFQRAITIAKDVGWDVVHRNEQAGSIEATYTSAWFGFVDDIVIRIRPQGSGSRVDLRSVSRVGVSDLGANAARILRFTKAFQQPAGE